MALIRLQVAKQILSDVYDVGEVGQTVPAGVRFDQDMDGEHVELVDPSNREYCLARIRVSDEGEVEATPIGDWQPL